MRADRGDRRAGARHLTGVEVGEHLVEQRGEGIAGASGVGLVALRLGAAGVVRRSLVVGLVRAEVVVAWAHVQRPLRARGQVLVLATLLHRAQGGRPRAWPITLHSAAKAPHEGCWRRMVL